MKIGRVIKKGITIALITAALLLQFEYKGMRASANAIVKTNEITGLASWYSQRETRNKHTASGEAFNENDFTCAIRDRGFGRYFKVTNLKNGKSVIVRHNDFGPARIYRGKRLGRAIDLSKAAFKQIAELKRGLIRVRIEEL